MRSGYVDMPKCPVETMGGERRNPVPRVSVHMQGAFTCMETESKGVLEYPYLGFMGAILGDTALMTTLLLGQHLPLKAPRPIHILPPSKLLADSAHGLLGGIRTGLWGGSSRWGIWKTWISIRRLHAPLFRFLGCGNRVSISGISVVYITGGSTSPELTVK
jgi:hypothetical protein